MFELQTWGDLADLRYGKALEGYRSGAPGLVPVFGTNGPIGFTQQPLVPHAGVIVGRKGAYRGVHFSRVPFWVIDTAFYLVPRQGIDVKWAYYALSLADINGLDSGSAIPSTTREGFYSLKVPVPSLLEQRAIAAVLGAIDDKLEANAKVVASAEALMVAMVSKTGRTRQLADLVVLHRDTVNPRSLKAELVHHFSLPAFDVGTGPEVAVPNSIKSAKFLIERPSVLVSKLNPRFPRLWEVAEMPKVPAVSSTEFLVLEPKFCSTAVLWSILSRPDFAQALDAKVAGTSGSHQRVSPTDILATDVLDPIELSQPLQNILTSMSEVARSHRRESEMLYKLREALLPQVISGKLRVRDAEMGLKEVL